MRSIVLAIILLAAGLPGVSIAQVHSYVLNGKVSNWSPPAQAFLIYSMDSTVRIDSTVIDKGRFTFHGKSLHPFDKPFLVVSKSGSRMGLTGVKSLQFYTDAPVISVHISDSLSSVTVEGGQLNKDDALLMTVSASVEAGIRAAMERYDAASASEKMEKGFEETWQRIIKTLEQERQSIYLKFIKSHPNSIVSLRALVALGGKNPDPAVVEAPFNALSPRIRATKEGVGYAATIKELRKIDIGRPAPDFTLYDTAGKPVALHDFKNQYLLLEFWASWCVACRAESPFIKEAYAAYKHRNFTVLSVTLDNPDKRDAWLKAIQEDQLPWAHVATNKMWDNVATRLYSITTIPRNFLIGPDGRIIAKNLRGNALKDKLRELLQD